MAIPAQQIGWSQQAKLLWQISKQLEQLTGVISKINNAPSNGWTFSPIGNLQWPVDTTGYTLYTGGWTSYDDGDATDPIAFGGEFWGNNVAETQFILSTNGLLSTSISNFQVAGNSQDLFLTPGDSLSDGDTQNFWYANSGTADKWKTSILVYCGHCCGPTQQATPYSYILNIYRDTQYQYVEARVKTLQEIVGLAGISSNSITQDSTEQSKVWQGDLTGSTWNYLGNGTVI
jgi:hypothetical protein